MGVLYSEVDLDQLVDAAKRDPRDSSPAMDEVVRRFRARAYKIAAAVVGERRDLLDDVATEAMCAVVKAVRKHSGRTSCVAYVNIYMTGAAQRCFNQSKGKYTEALDSPEAERVIGTLFSPDATSGWGDGEVADAVASLPPTQQELLWRRYGLCWTLKEIGEARLITVSAVSQQLMTAHRAILAAVA